MLHNNDKTIYFQNGTAKINTKYVCSLDYTVLSPEEFELQLALKSKRFTYSDFLGLIIGSRLSSVVFNFFYETLKNSTIFDKFLKNIKTIQLIETIYKFNYDDFYDEYEVYDKYKLKSPNKNLPDYLLNMSIFYKTMKKWIDTVPIAFGDFVDIQSYDDYYKFQRDIEKIRRKNKFRLYDIIYKKSPKIFDEFYNTFFWIFNNKTKMDKYDKQFVKWYVSKCHNITKNSKYVNYKYEETN